MEKARRLWALAEKHALPWLSLLVSCGVGTWFMSLFGQVMDMYLEYPLPLASVFSFSFVLGMLFMHLLGLRDKMLKRYDEKRVAEKAEKEAEEKERKAKEAKADSFIAETPALKMACLIMFEEGHYDLQDDLDKNDFYRIVCYAKGERRIGCTRYTLTDRTRKAFEEHPEVLDYPRELLEESRAKETAIQERELHRRLFGCGAEDFIETLGKSESAILALLLENGGELDEEKHRKIIADAQGVRDLLRYEELGDGSKIISLDGEAHAALLGREGDLRHHAGVLARQELGL